MRNRMLSVLVIGCFLIASCGKVGTTPMAMSEDEALSTLGAFTSGNSTESPEELVAILQNAIDNGDLKIRGADGRLATGSAIDLKALQTLLAAIGGTNGKTNSILTIAMTVLSAFGNTTSTGNKLTDIMNILNQALPMIQAIAPQYAGIITAVMTIIPLVVNLINMFKKPKTVAAF